MSDLGPYDEKRGVWPNARCRCNERRWIKVGGWHANADPDDYFACEAFQMCQDCGASISLGIEGPPE